MSVFFPLDVRRGRPILSLSSPDTKGTAAMENNTTELDFDMFATPPTRISLARTGVRGTNRNDVAVAEKDNWRVTHPRKSKSKVR